MPVQKCSNGKWKIGASGKCIYTTKEDADKAYAAYLAKNKGAASMPNATGRRETRNLAQVLEVREGEGDEHGIDLRVITYTDQPDDYGTLWAPGVFAESLEERLPRLVWSHDWRDPLGRGSEVLGDGDEATDIRFVYDNFEDVPSARRAWSQARSGTVDQASVGFYRQEWESLNPQDNNGAYERITRARLDEVSQTLSGAVTGTAVLGVRSREGQVQFLEEALRSAPPDVVEEACRAWLAERASSTQEERDARERELRELDTRAAEALQRVSLHRGRRARLR